MRCPWQASQTRCLLSIAREDRRQLPIGQALNYDRVRHACGTGLSRILLTANVTAMKFIEMSGKTLLKIVTHDEMEALKAAGITEHALLRINPQGDLEVRQRAAWGIIGGLLGDYEHRVKAATGLEWA